MISTRESNDSAFAISTICCFATVSRPTGVRGSSEPHPREDRGRVAVEPVLVDEHAEAAARLPADEDVLRDAQVVHQVQLLMDDADAERLRRARLGDLHRAAVDPDLAAVLLIDAGEDLHQRRFARAVLAHQRMHFAGAQVEAAVVEREHAGKALADAAQRDQRRRVVGVRVCSHRSPPSVDRTIEMRVTAVDEQPLAGRVRRARRQQEHGGIGDLFRRREALAERHLAAIAASFASGSSKPAIQLRYNGVITSAGITALTRTPSSRSATAHSRVSASCAPFDAQ
jgi:hypothetical protein